MKDILTPENRETMRRIREEYVKLSDHDKKFPPVVPRTQADKNCTELLAILDNLPSPKQYTEEQIIRAAKDAQWKGEFGVGGENFSDFKDVLMGVVWAFNFLTKSINSNNE